MTHIDNLTPRAIDAAARSRHHVNLYARALSRCWWWQSARKKVLRELLTAQLLLLFACYGMPAGSAIEVPKGWIK